jgi:enoyl-CoA hydratase/carnithine racemase
MLDAALPEAQRLFHVCSDMMNTVQRMPQVVIAKVHALATAAGCQLVATCDLAVAAESAGFALPGGRGGLFCHTPLVAVGRQIGRKRALEMADRRRDPTTAAGWLINRSCPTRARCRGRRPDGGAGGTASKAAGKRAFYAQIDSTSARLRLRLR